MAETRAALNFEKCANYVRAIQEHCDKIHNLSGQFVAASEEALQKSTEQKWLRDIVNIGNECQKQCVETSEGLDTMIDGLRKYDADLRDFSNSGITADV